MRESLQLVLMRTWRWIRKSFWPVLMRKWTWIRKTKNDIHSSDFDVFFFFSHSLFKQRGESYWHASSGIGLRFDLYIFPPKLVAASIHETKKKKDTSQLWGQKVQHTMRAKKKNII